MADEKPIEPAGEKPAAVPAAAHAPKPAVKDASTPCGEPWTGELAETIKAAFPDAGIEAWTYLSQNYLIVHRDRILDLCKYLRDEAGFALLADLTAADYPKRERRFDVIYQLLSFTRNERLRVKSYVGESESIESVMPIWIGADWMEREVFDMFGIRFEHHPNLKRILLPDEWDGHPLRKDYSILKQDQKWVQENLHIQSGQ
jgi:NADH-quinone oxidoreductase subunit C